jgi:hypothetical protein
LVFGAPFFPSNNDNPHLYTPPHGHQFHFFYISLDTMVDANEQLQVLLRQETTTYKTEDYLMRLQQQQQQQRIDAPPHSSVASRDGSASSAGIIDQRWREKICEWAYKGE